MIFMIFSQIFLKTGSFIPRFHIELSFFQPTNEGLGRLSQKIIVEVKPRNVVLNLRAKGVSTHTMELSWSPPIDLTPINYKISYNAYKEFVDAQGVTQSTHIPTITILVSPKTNTYKINDLSPFTTYHVNVSAIPNDR